jgi:arylsulfatase A-like enzyme
MHKRTSLLMLAVVVAWPISGRAGGAPNLVVIMADDLGYADVGFNGCRDIPTPNIDRIAVNGVKCTSGYVSYPVCGPSRAGFITGRYQQRFGFERNPQYRPADPAMGLTRDETTLAEALGKVGYTSGIVGKWHLGAHPSNHPLNRGFDAFFGHLGGGHTYFPDKLNIKDSYGIQTEWESYRTWIMRDHEPVQIDQYLTDAFSDEAVRFVDRNRDGPFFLFLSYNAPHTPLEATEVYLARFPDIADRKRRTYAAMVSAVDDGVGRLLDKLEHLQLAEKTLVFFLSDNGGPESKNGSDNGPLRGGKSDVWEGGFRVPFAVQWKGTLPAGAVYHHPVSSLDIFATMAGLAMVPTDPARPLDGVNLVPHLTGGARRPPHETVYLRKFDQGRYAVRHGTFKLVIPAKDGRPQLYDLAADLGEGKDLAALQPEDVRTLDQLRLAWDAELIDPTFLGLIHTDAWKARPGKQKQDGQPQGAPE